MAATFLKAEWRRLAMANYAVDESLLHPWLPAGTEIDLWKGICYISLVGFLFVDTRVKGIRVPFHTTFEEVNLRFYVQHQHAEGSKRGVVFLREIVSKPMLTLAANALYQENYVTMPMRHRWETSGGRMLTEYEWKTSRWHSFQVTTGSSCGPIAPGSEAEFITEHYWGDTKLRDGTTAEYEVAHPRWDIYPVEDHRIDVDFGDVYGERFRFLAREKPLSVFLAEGSSIEVKVGRRL